MKNNKSVRKWILLFLLTAGITLLHYSLDQGQYYYHVFYGELYFLPIVLAAFWFGLRGALVISITITACYLPFVLGHWQGFSPEDLDGILSLLLYNGLAVLTGILKDRETTASNKLLQAENLAVMGRSLAAVAHDMKTPLMLIGGFAGRILKKTAPADPARRKLALIVKETEKLEVLTRDMLDFSKPLVLHPVREDFNKTIRNALIKTEQAAQNRNVEIRYRAPTGTVGLHYDPLRLEQVLVNLLLNAIETSPAGTTVEVTLSPSPDGITLDVADNGCGISFIDRQKVFDPFYTTKKEGTGLGLPIVKKIIEAHDGSLQILENRGCGTIFRINLSATGYL